mgnify:CR=1 FL=1
MEYETERGGYGELQLIEEQPSAACHRPLLIYFTLTRLLKGQSLTEINTSIPGYLITISIGVFDVGCVNPRHCHEFALRQFR